MNNYNPLLKEPVEVNPSLKLQQFRFELDTWKRQTELMMETNIHLKNTVAGILQNDYSNFHLEDLESYVNKFLKEDELIAILKNEIAAFERLAGVAGNNEFTDIVDMDLRLRFIRNDVLDTKIKFDILQTGFYTFLIKHIQAYNH